MFSLKTQWNKAISEQDSYPRTERSHIWASEITKPLVDLWLRTRAVEPTNPPNARSIRKFTAGDCTEDIVATVLRAIGADIEQQHAIGLEIAGLKITGKIDFIYRGNKQPVIDSNAPRTIKRLAQAIHEISSEPTVLEIKSLGLYGFNRVEATSKPLPSHLMQTFLYAYSTGLPAVLVCISRDDMRIEEFQISPSDPELLKALTEKAQTIVTVLARDSMPEPEKTIVWNGYKFEQNMDIRFSDYLSLLYGTDEESDILTMFGQKPFEDADQYSEWATKIVSPLNKAVKERATGKTFATASAQANQKLRTEELNNYCKKNNITIDWDYVKKIYQKLPEEE
jgi:hypothetical protein